MRRTAFLVSVLLAGCGGGGGGGGGDDDARPRPEPPISGTVDLERPRAGAPDAGTVAGHGADAGIGTTSAEAFSFTGRVSPPDSAVRVSEGDVRVEPSGRFTVAVLSPRRGDKQVTIEATKPGHRSWRVDVRVTRGEPQRVRVPERDVTAPTAALVLDRGDGRPPIVVASPSRQGEKAELLLRGARSITATAVARDTGGTGRIRLSFTRTGRCGGRNVRAQTYLPPAQVERIAVPPGASAPVERERTARVPIAPQPGCRVSGEIWAEATDAHGLQAVTRHAGFRHP
jgi:hypothetical protein